MRLILLAKVRLANSHCDVVGVDPVLICNHGFRASGAMVASPVWGSIDQLFGWELRRRARTEK